MQNSKILLDPNAKPFNDLCVICDEPHVKTKMCRYDRLTQLVTVLKTQNDRGAQAYAQMQSNALYFRSLIIAMTKKFEVLDKDFELLMKLTGEHHDGQIVIQKFEEMRKAHGDAELQAETPQGDNEVVQSKVTANDNVRPLVEKVSP